MGCVGCLDDELSLCVYILDDVLGLMVACRGGYSYGPIQSVSLVPAELNLSIGVRRVGSDWTDRSMVIGFFRLEGVITYVLMPMRY
jgi:hypothetical protein